MITYLKWKVIVSVFALVMIWLTLSVAWGVLTQFKYDKLRWYKIYIFPELSLELITYNNKCAFAILNFSCASTELMVGEGVLMASAPRRSMMIIKGNTYLIHQDLNIFSSQLEFYNAKPYPLFSLNCLYQGEPLNYHTLKDAVASPHYNYRFEFFKKALIHCRSDFP